MPNMQNNTYYMIPFIWDIQSRETEQLVVTRGWGCDCYFAFEVYVWDNEKALEPDSDVSWKTPECTCCHQTVHFKMVTTVNLLCILQQLKK